MINPTLPQKNLVLQTLHAQYLRSIMTLPSDKHANYWALRKTIERLRTFELELIESAKTEHSQLLHQYYCSIES